MAEIIPFRQKPDLHSQEVDKTEKIAQIQQLFMAAAKPKYVGMDELVERLVLSVERIENRLNTQARESIL